MACKSSARQHPYQIEFDYTVISSQSQQDRPLRAGRNQPRPGHRHGKMYTPPDRNVLAGLCPSRERCALYFASTVMVLLPGSVSLPLRVIEPSVLSITICLASSWPSPMMILNQFDLEPPG